MLIRMIEYDPNKILGLLLLMKTLINSPKVTEESQTKYLERLLFIGRQSIASMNTINNNTDQLLNLKVFQMTSDIIYMLIDKYQYKIKNISKIPFLKDLLVFFEIVLMLDHTNTENHLICFIIDKNVSDCINSAKLYVLKSIHILFQLFCGNRGKLEIQTSAIDKMLVIDSFIFFTNLVKLMIKEIHDSIKKALEIGFTFTTEV